MGSRDSYIADSSNQFEIARLIVQDRLITSQMGGPLFGWSESVMDQVEHVLDIACGPGGWCLDLAELYPTIKITGIDKSPHMVELARMYARAENASNVSFQQMDALAYPLPFEDNSFDFINARLLESFMPLAAWTAFLGECQRLLRPGGLFRWTEMEIAITNGACLNKCNRLFYQALQQAGHAPSAASSGIGVTPLLPYHLRKAGFQRVNCRAYSHDCSQGAVGYASSLEDYQMLFHMSLPFLLQHGIDRVEIEQLYEQSLVEMKREDHCSMVYYLAAWGENPSH